MVGGCILVHPSIPHLLPFLFFVVVENTMCACPPHPGVSITNLAAALQRTNTEARPSNGLICVRCVGDLAFDPPRRWIATIAGSTAFTAVTRRCLASLCTRSIAGQVAFSWDSVLWLVSMRHSFQLTMLLRRWARRCESLSTRIGWTFFSFSSN